MNAGFVSRLPAGEVGVVRQHALIKHLDKLAGRRGYELTYSDAKIASANGGQLPLSASHQPG